MSYKLIRYLALANLVLTSYAEPLCAQSQVMLRLDVEADVEPEYQAAAWQAKRILREANSKWQQEVFRPPLPVWGSEGGLWVGGRLVPREETRRWNDAYIERLRDVRRYRKFTDEINRVATPLYESLLPHLVRPEKVIVGRMIGGAASRRRASSQLSYLLVEDPVFREHLKLTSQQVNELFRFCTNRLNKPKQQIGDGPEFWALFETSQKSMILQTLSDSQRSSFLKEMEHSFP